MDKMLGAAMGTREFSAAVVRALGVGCMDFGMRLVFLMGTLAAGYRGLDVSMSCGAFPEVFRCK